ncbi:MAG: L-threonylcarbamoyladenylate synthase [Phycisphaerae bacterium]
MSSTQVLRVEKPDELAQAAEIAARAVANGKLVGFPTETVYGIAVNAANPAALNRLRELKGRPDRPFSLHLPDPEALGQYIRKVPDEARRLIQRAWPGPVTVILPTGGQLARDDYNTPELIDALCYQGMLGLRCPDAPGSIEMLGRVDAPVVAPSANLAGQPSPRNGQDVLDALNGKIDVLLDTGPTRLGTDSTVVRIEPGKVQVLRESAVPAEQIDRMVTRRYVFVCTGNTCRSPMAEGLARKMLAEKLGVRPGQLAKRKIEVISAGAMAFDGASATEEAVRAAGALGADIANHRSRMLTSELIHSADLVFCMTRDHLAQATGLAPNATDTILLLDRDRDIADPIGAPQQVYQQTAEQIRDALGSLMDEGTL